jgi:uroporphyrinogen-III synthase
MVCKVSEQVSRKEIIRTEKKGRILNAAALLFSRRQYHEVMIEDVARLASIAKGTVYNYFSSKEDIYFSIMLERMDNLITSLDQKIKTDADSSSALRTFVIHLYMFMMKYQDFFLMFRKETLKAENELCSNIAKMQTQLRDMLKDIIAKGIDNFVFRKMNIGFAADLITGTIFASVNRGIEKNYTEDEMKFERSELFNFIYEGMASQSVHLPLSSKTIVLTRTEEQNQETAEMFRSAGATVLSFPSIKIVPLETEDLNKYLSPSPDYIIFTSGNAVKIFIDKIDDIASINREITRIAAIGTKTADICRKLNLSPDIIPAKNSAEGFIEYFKTVNVKGQTFLIPRSAIGREELIDYLKGRDAAVSVINIYDTVMPSAEELEEHMEKLFSRRIDVITFASPSAFRNFLQITGSRGEELLRKVNIAAVGTTTSAEITAAGFETSIQPDDFNMDGLKKAIIDFYK